MTKPNTLPEEVEKKLQGLRNWSNKVFPAKAASLVDQTAEVLREHYAQEIATAKREERALGAIKQLALLCDLIEPKVLKEAVRQLPQDKKIILYNLIQKLTPTKTE